jgi:flagellar basal-body rod modification protein FlgD
MTTTISALQSTVNSTTSSSTTTDSVSETEDRFMKLLIAQMQNQDPLNPLDNAEVTSQMAQLSTVTGITQLNTTLTSLQSSLTSNQTLQAADMIDHGVLVSGSAVTLSSSVGAMGVTLADAADTVTATISDSSGNVVKTISLGAQSAGTLSFTWDGSTDSGTTASDGNYTFSVEASNSGTSVTATTLSYGTVNSVSAGSSGVTLNVGNVGSVSVSDVVQIF